MSVVITCRQCGKQYRVGDEMLGRRAKCQQCGEVIVLESPEATTPPNPFADLPVSADVPSRPLAPAIPRQPPIATLTDRQFRIGAAVFIPVIALGMAAAFVAVDRRQPGMAVVVVGLGPFAIFYGVAALINPDVVRAATKHGAHLPKRYKLIAAAVGIAALACSALATWGFLAG